MDSTEHPLLKAIVLWTLVVGLYSGLYYVGREGGPVVLSLLVGIPVGATTIIAVVKAIRNRREQRRYYVESGEGCLAIGRGDLERARGIFWRWAEQAAIPMNAAHARHNLAWTFMCQGKLREAIAISTESDNRYPIALNAMGFYPLTPLNLALFHALLGNLDAAQQLLTASDERTTPLCDPVVAAMKPYARAVLLCRSGHCHDAARLLDDHWAACETLLTGDNLRPLRVLRAFAVAAGGPRSAGLAEAIVATARPSYPGEYDFLGAAWPEMAAFLATHELTRRPTAPE